MAITSANNEEHSQQTKTMEERLQPWIDQGEYIIVITLVIMAWTAGWVDLFAFETDETQVFGRYPVEFFAFLVVYTISLGFWFYVISSPAAVKAFRQTIALIQRTPFLFVGAWAVFAVVLWSMPNFGPWARLQLLQGTVLVLITLFTLVVLLAKPFEDSPFQTWRKVALGIIGALLLAEGALQGLAYVDALPVDNVSGVTVPYGRIYQDEEGFADGQTNQYGWYYPEFRLEEGTRRILLSGDSFIEALQIPAEEHMGLQLEQLINAESENTTEVIAQGQPGYGAAFYMNPIMYRYIWEPMQPTEMIVFFHLANDFQVVFDEPGKQPRLFLLEDGEPSVVEDDFGRWHFLAHRVIAGHDPIILTRTIASNSLLFSAADSTVRNVFNIEAPLPEIPLHTDEITEEQPLGTATFVFDPNGDERADRAYALLEAQINQYADFMAEQGIRVHLVTIPYFPQDFYENADWNTQIGEYDLLLPEGRIAEIAAENGVAFLGMGEMMQTSGITPAEIQALYFRNGSGHLTEAGHDYFAQAIFDCFYSTTSSTDTAAGCVAN